MPFPFVTLLTALFFVLTSLGNTYNDVLGVTDDSSTPQELNMHATIESVGIVSSYQGDNNNNNTATTYYRKSGESSWLEAHPMSKDVDSHEWRVSLVYLEPDTEYDVEVRYDDPDGADPPVQSQTMRTRLDYPNIGETNAIHTVPTDGTLQDLVDLAEPGDKIQLLSGTYYTDEILIYEGDSGAAGQYITIEPSPGASVIIDGSDTEINGATDNWIFYQNTDKGSVYYADLAWGDTSCSESTMIPNYVGEQIEDDGVRYLLFDSRQSWENDFLIAPPGKAFYVCNDSGPGPIGRLYVVTYDGDDPDNHEMHISRYKRAFRIKGEDYIRIRGLEFRYYGLAAINIVDNNGVGSDNNIFENNTFHGIGEWPIRLEGVDVSDNLIQKNTIYEKGYRDSQWQWEVYYQEGRGDTTGISLSNAGSGNVIRENTITSGSDAININNNTSNVDVYNNNIFECMDNGIEVDSTPGSNIRVWDNRISDCFAPLSMQDWSGNGSGPVYFFRNVITGGDDPLGRLDDLGGNKGYAVGHAFKLGGVDNYSGESFIYHNTFSIQRSELGLGHGLNDASGQYISNITSRNNIWAVTGDVINFDSSNTTTVNHDLDCDNFHQSELGKSFILWGTSGGPDGDGRYKSLADFQSYENQELNGISDTSTLFDYSMGLKPGSPEIDAGCAITGFNDRGPDMQQGSAPDMGAFEYENPSCIPGDVSKALSSVVAEKPQVASDGLETGVITVTLKDECNNLMVGTQVTLASSRGDKDVISPSTATTDSQGKAVFTVSSNITSSFSEGVYASSNFRATANSIVLNEISSIAFECVSAQLDESNDLNLRFQLTNDTVTMRRMAKLKLSWPVGELRALTSIDLYPNTIWTGLSIVSPVKIDDESSWLGEPSLRYIGPSTSNLLKLTFNFDLIDLPGDNTFQLLTEWIDTANEGSVCVSAPILITL